MMRRFAFVFLLLLSPAQLLAEGHVPLARAFEAMRAGDMRGALEIAGQVSPAAQDLIDWHRLRAGRGSTGEVIDFLARNPDWPGLPWLRKKSEPGLLKASDADVLTFLGDDLPQTPEGALAHARALRAKGQKSAADAALVLAWRSMAIGPQMHERFLKEHGALLKKHHVARMDMVLWENWKNNANRMMPLVDEKVQQLARARMALRARSANANALVQALPEALTSDPGLAFERFVWRARSGMQEAAIDLALSASKSAKTLGEPQYWSNRRRSLARQLMRDKAYERAYALASQHHLSEGSNFADLEWLSGYIALRFLKKPSDALAHFRAFQGAVVTPISLGRAGYWIGRAQEALGDKKAAQQAYAFGAQYQTSFYGLLAAEKGGLDFDERLAGKEDLPDWREAGFMESSVFQAAVLALQAGEYDLSERFLTHLTEALSEVEAAQLGQIAIDLNEPHIAVMIGKRAASRGMTVPAPYYALHDMVQNSYPISKEFALSIARRESEFDPSVVSGAGAMGLMQVMPGTARDVSKELGLPYAKAKLTQDWRYNAKLGTAYLARLHKQFDGNPMMIAAGYNAGPGRPVGWMKRYGDPRKLGTDFVDWIEHIPFRETRNYVMRVTESLPIYRARLGRAPLPKPFSQELTQ